MPGALFNVQERKRGGREAAGHPMVITYGKEGREVGWANK